MCPHALRNSSFALSGDFLITAACTQCSVELYCQGVDGDCEEMTVSSDLGSGIGPSIFANVLCRDNIPAGSSHAPLFREPNFRALGSRAQNRVSQKGVWYEPRVRSAQAQIRVFECHRVTRYRFLPPGIDRASKSR